jgi:hypothetical protein
MNMKPRLKFVERQHDPFFRMDCFVWVAVTSGYLDINGRQTPITEGSTVTLPVDVLGPQWESEVPQ